MLVLDQALISLPNFLLILVAVGLLVPSFVFSVECLFSLFPRDIDQTSGYSYRPSLAVLIPAHNEASEIGGTLQMILPQLNKQDQLVVVADNCEDNTADIARMWGAVAIARSDTEKRGKGYALDFGLNYLAAQPPEVVIMIDADCRVQSQTIELLACRAYQQNRPVQAAYTMQKPACGSPKITISTLAFLVKNLARPWGLARMGLPIMLTGTGMAFPWSIIQTCSLATSNIVEDMQLGIDLAIAGYPPIFCPEAHVIGSLPRQDEVAQRQRTRWEHGHLRTLLTQVPKLIKQAILQPSFQLFMLALDLLIPPLSLLVMILTFSLLLAILSILMGGSWIPLMLLILAMCLILLGTFQAWFKFGRIIIKPRDFLAIPWYVMWKVPLYFKFVFKPENTWIKTDREINQV